MIDDSKRTFVDVDAKKRLRNKVFVKVHLRERLECSFAEKSFLLWTLQDMCVNWQI